MALLQSDNCLLARGTAAVPTANNPVAGWNPSSNGNQWISLSAANTCGSANPGLTMTGTTTLSSNTLTTNMYREGVCQLTFTKANADRVAIIFRAQNSSNYYSVDLAAGNFRIRKFVSNGNTNLVTQAFTDAGAKTNLKVTFQGFGTQGPNIVAKAWLEGSPESGATVISATDSSLTNAGMVGVLVTLGLGTNTATIFSFTYHELDWMRSIFAAPTYKATANLKKGMTYNVVSNTLLPNSVVADMVTMGNGSWMRIQNKWTQIEYSQGLYDWSILDDMVWKLNTNGIRIMWNIQSPPSWKQTLDGCGNDSTLTSTITAGAVTSIPITPLRAGAYIPNGVKFNLGGPDVFTVNNPGGVYTAGATAITVTGTATQTYNIGAQLIENTGGLAICNAENFSTFAGLAAERYNGLNGLGYIDAFQIENEQYDSGAVRINAQVTPIPVTWNGLTAWENGGAILAPVYDACYTKIRTVNQTSAILPCSVRGTPSYGLNHRLNWIQGFLSNISAQHPPKFIDYHFYTGGSVTCDNTTNFDPLIDKYDCSGTVNNFPAMTTINNGIQSLLNQYGFTACAILMGEFGYDKFDDGGGENRLTNSAYNSGTPTSTILLTANHTSAWPDGTSIYIDNGSANFEVVYAWGPNNAGSNTVNITTDPRGKGNTNNPQLSWNPANNHLSGVNVYAATGVYRISSQAQDAQFTGEILNNLPAGGKAFYFTDTHAGTATSGNHPDTSTNPKALFQTIGGIPTYVSAFNTMVSS